MFYASCSSVIVLCTAFSRCVHGWHYMRREISEKVVLDARSDGKHSDGKLDPINFVIHCPQDVDRMDRFQRHMQQADLAFKKFPCIHPTLNQIQEAVQEGLLSSNAEHDAVHHSGTLGVGLTHMRLLQEIVNRSLPAANIFEDDEVVPNNYYSERSKILASLPETAEFVNLNALRAEGDPVDGADGRILKMQPGPCRSPMYNVWLSNYYVTAAGARKVLKLMSGFDLGSENQDEIDWRLSEAVAGGQPLEGYVVKTNSLSQHCEQASTKHKNDEKGTSLVSGGCDEI
mmetsp:Transcript_83336/g.147594  ORF Transcript_83336/g.147594 Transcript_83336/m.147594 type:complete len:287 (-) Transcript_83336:144-1004(-)